jgi:hypothetical protein
MTKAATFALERLTILARLFDHARVYARNDSLALAEILDQAAVLLDEIAPAVAACKGGPDEQIVLEAACAAREHHVNLVQSIGIEIDRITKELDRLSRSTLANSGYAGVAKAPKLRLMERSA